MAILFQLSSPIISAVCALLHQLLGLLGLGLKTIKSVLQRASLMNNARRPFSIRTLAHAYKGTNDA